MALTLADYSARADTPLTSGVIDTMRKVTPLMDKIPFEDVGSLTIKNFRTKSMPTIGWRKIGESHGTSKAQYEPVTEQAYSFGDYIDVDKVLDRDKGSLINNRAYQVEMAVKAMTKEFLDKFINGSPSVDEDAIIGLWYRSQKDLPTAQSILAASGGLDISADATSLAANQNTMIDKLDELIDSIDDGAPEVLLMNSTMRLRLLSALRQLKLLDTTQDMFGRTIPTYGTGGPMIIDMGFKGDDSTKIITDTETAAGSALTGGGCTSIYAMRFGKEYLTGWQQYALEVTDKGELENGVSLRTIVDWVIGLSIVNPRSVSRLYALTAK